MKRRKIELATVIFIGLAFLVGMMGVGCKEEKAVDYYPLGIGSYWEYNVIFFLKTGITKLTKDTIKVVGKEKVDNTECYVVDRFSTDATPPSLVQYREFLAKTNDGVTCTKRAFPFLIDLKLYYPSVQSEILHSPEEIRFKNNPKTGDTWKWDGIITLVPENQEPEGKNGKTSDKNQAPSKPPKIKQIKGSLEYKYLGHETIHILNKDMDCIKMSVFGKSEGGQEIESTVWYGPGIGRVREEQKLFEGSESISCVFELSNYNITNREPFKGK